jgi:hypothetical protein
MALRSITSTASKVKKPKTFTLTLEMTESEYEVFKDALVSLWISFEYDARRVAA